MEQPGSDLLESFSATESKFSLSWSNLRDFQEGRAVLNVLICSGTVLLWGISDQALTPGLNTDIRQIFQSEILKYWNIEIYCYKLELLRSIKCSVDNTAVYEDLINLFYISNNAWLLLLTLLSINYSYYYLTLISNRCVFFLYVFFFKFSGEENLDLRNRFK